MREDYERLGTTPEAVKYDMMNGNKPRTGEQQDRFLREKYESELKMIQRRQEIAKTRGDEIKLKELKREEQELTLSYQRISSEASRSQTNDTEDATCQKQVTRKKTPYDILNINVKKLEGLPEGEKNEYIEGKKVELLSMCQRDLEKAKKLGDGLKGKKFRDSLKVKTYMKEIKEAYEKVNTAEKRNNYDEQRQKEEERENEKVKAKMIEEKYSHANEYNPDLINDISSSDHKSLQTKMVERQEVLSREYSYDDEENRQLRLRRIAEIKFRTCVGKLSISEYEVKRVIVGQEKVDRVYTDAPIIYLSIDEKTGKPINPDYYDCFINKLLAEDTIEGSKYNGGFIGGIEQDEKGNYYITLEKECLSPMEQEQLTAVMIIEQKEKNIKEKGEENII